MKKWGYAWGGLAILSLIPGLYLFVLGQTGSEMIRGAGLLMCSGYCLAMTVHKVKRKAEVN